MTWPCKEFHMNKFLSLSALSVFFIALAMPLPLFADGNRGEGGGGDSHDRHKKVEEGSGSSAMDQHKKSTMEYKNHPEGKASDYKKAMLLFYEQNNLTEFKNIFMSQYEYAVNKYFNLEPEMTE